MPLYEYLCRDCDREIEVLVRYESEKPACPDCGGGKLMKLLSVPAARVGSSPENDPTPPGSCGSGCGCFPAG